MIKAVLFDWGNVLNSYNGVEEACAKRLGLSFDEFKKRFTPELIREWHLGLDERELWNKVLHPRKYDGPLFWLEEFKRIVRFNEKLFEFARQLRDKGFLIAIVSNAERPNVKFLRENVESNPRYGIFHAYVYSCDKAILSVKPEKRIYRITLERLRITNPASAVLVDDNDAFVQGFKILGGHGIYHHDNEATIRELSGILKINY